MTTLRRILITAVATAAISSIASADLIIGYSTTLGPTSTDILNGSPSGTPINLPAFDPGGTTTLDLTMLSNVSHAGSNYTPGITMASLDAPLTSYTLVGYDITVSETLGGSYSVTNTSTNQTATGSLFVDTYTSVALGGINAPPLSAISDPANDLFNYSKTAIGINPPSGPVGAPGELSSSIGGGPDPSGANTGSFSLAPGASTGTVSGTGSSPVVDYGAELTANPNGDCASEFGYNWSADCTDSHNYNAYNNGYFIPVGTGVNVSSPSDLALYLSTITDIDYNGSGGNLQLNSALNVTETVTVSYDIVINSAAPEPTTMALMGGALIGLGLIGKRLKKN
jgi:hypothetical protein